MKTFNLVFLMMLVSSLSVAQWTNSSVIGVPVTLTQASTGSRQSISDGSGGAIMCWQDYRSGNWRIYAQKVDSDGVCQWTANGVIISLLDGNHNFPQLTGDGHGGAIITWSSSGAIHAQRINSLGSILWSSNGVTVKSGNVALPCIISDESGGAIISWGESTSGGYFIFTQRINSIGQLLWSASGIRITKNPNITLQNPRSIGDGEGGVIICCYSVNSPYNRITAQRINSNGQILWNDSNGSVVHLAPVIGGLYPSLLPPNICSDGNGGAIINFGKNSSAAGYPSMYVQKIDANGIIQWDTNAVAVCNNDTVQYGLNLPGLISDGFGGAITGWSDGRSIFTQKINSNGAVQWGIQGLQISSRVEQSYPELVTDGSGGTIVCWQDQSYAGVGVSIYAQRVYTNGDLQWGINGIPVIQNIANNFNPSIVIQNPHGVIISWHQQYANIYCARISTRYIDLKCYLQGFYDPNTNSTARDTITLNIRKGISLYNIISTYKAQQDQNGYNRINIPYLDTYTPYYLQINHRNSVETWSNPIYITSSENFIQDFTIDISQAYGNNMIQVDTSPVRFAIYSGNVNQDGIIDAGDLSLVDNDVFNSVSGYVPTDVTGNNFVDASDLSIVDNNVYNGIMVIKP